MDGMTIPGFLQKLVLVVVGIFVLTASAVEGDPCAPGYIALSTGQCVAYHNQPSSFSSAEAVCQADGGHLVSIHDKQTNQALYLKSLAEGGDHPGVLVGLQSFAGLSSWSDNTNYDYNNFATGEPNFANGICVGLMLSVSGRWISVDCNDPWLPFFCEQPTGTSATSTTSSSTMPSTTTRAATIVSTTTTTSLCQRSTVLSTKGTVGTAQPTSATSTPSSSSMPSTTASNICIKTSTTRSASIMSTSTPSNLCQRTTVLSTRAMTTKSTTIANNLCGPRNRLRR